MASFFGGLRRAIGQEFREDFSQNPIVRTIQALRRKRQAPQMAGSPTAQGVFAPGVFEPPIPQAPGAGTGGVGPFGPIY